jgi:hypothetical protein
MAVQNQYLRPIKAALQQLGTPDKPETEEGIKAEESLDNII